MVYTAAPLPFSEAAKAETAVSFKERQHGKTTTRKTMHNERQLSDLAQRYIEKLSLFVEGYQIGLAGL